MKTKEETYINIIQEYKDNNKALLRVIDQFKLEVQQLQSDKNGLVNGINKAYEIINEYSENCPIDFTDTISMKNIELIENIIKKHRLQ